MALVAVVIRQLKNNRPVTSKIIEAPNDPDVDYGVDYQEGYLLSVAKDHIRTFKTVLPEFIDATWYIDIIDKCTDKVITTEKI